MAKNVAAPQVPGAPVADSAATDPADQAQVGTTIETEGETVAVPKAQLEALLARVSALETAQQQNPVAKRANPEADLPDQDDVDASTLKLPVLSKQGWILPANYGANPVAKNL